MLTERSGAKEKTDPRPVSFTWWFLEGRKSWTSLPQAFEFPDGLIDSIRSRTKLARKRQDRVNIGVGKLSIRRGVWTVEPKTREPHLDVVHFDPPKLEGNQARGFNNQTDKAFDQATANIQRIRESGRVGAIIIIGNTPFLIIDVGPGHRMGVPEVAARLMLSKINTFRHFRQTLLEQDEMTVEHIWVARLESSLAQFSSISGVIPYKQNDANRPNILEKFA